MFAFPSSDPLAIFPPVHSLFDVFELLDILDFDIVWVVCEQVDGARNHILRQQAQQFVCRQTQEQIQQLYLTAVVLTWSYMQLVLSQRRWKSFLTKAIQQYRKFHQCGT